MYIKTVFESELFWILKGLQVLNSFQETKVNLLRNTIFFQRL